MLSSVMQFFQAGIKTTRLLVGIKAALTAGTSISNATGAKEFAGIFTTVASSGTGKMPPWQNGRLAVVLNQGANNLTLYSYEGAAIPTPYAQKVQFQPPLQSTGMTPGDTGITVATGKSVWFIGSLDPTGAYPVWNEVSAPGN